MLANMYDHALMANFSCSPFTNVQDSVTYTEKKWRKNIGWKYDLNCTSARYKAKKRAVYLARANCNISFGTMPAHVRHINTI